MSPASRSIMAILDFYAASGVDCPLATSAIDRFATTTEARASQRAAFSTPPSQGKPSVARPSVAPVRAEEAVLTARQLAKAAQTLEEVRKALLDFNACALKATATQLVFADGNPEAKVMVIGEAPGREEDQIGKPFVGRSGQLLDKMLQSIGLDRTNCYITNVVPWRPPGNRTPTPQELAMCLPFIERQIELVLPDVMVLLGGAAVSALVGGTEGITKVRGKWFSYIAREEHGEKNIRALASFHPAYLLRTPLQKRRAWQDLRALKKAL